MKLKALFLLASTLMLGLVGQAQEKWTKTDVGDAIQVALPLNLAPVLEQDLPEKYISYRTPLALYTSPDRKADFSVNLTATPWSDSDLSLMKDFYKASLSTLYSDIKWIKEEIVDVNKQPYAIFEYIGIVAQDEKENAIRSLSPLETYNYIAYTIKNNKVAVFRFSAPANQRGLYQPTAERIMQSIKIKKDL